MRISWSLDSGIYLSPNQMWSNISCRIKFFLNLRPKMNGKIIIINLKRQIILFFFGFQLFGQILFLTFLSQLNLAHILMFKFFLIWVINFFLNFFEHFSLNFTLICIIVAEVVFDHHNTFFLIMPCSFRILLNSMLVSNEEWFL